MTPNEEPTTEAGRELLQRATDGGWQTWAGDAVNLPGLRRAILAIESEARATAPADHEHYWIDAPDDETGWYCPVCGLTEYPGMVDEITPREANGGAALAADSEPDR